MGAVVDLPVERALAGLMGMEVMKLARSTGDLQRDFNDWALRTDEALSSLDGVYVHIKAPDIPSHDGDAEGKVRVLEAIDRGFFGRLGELLDLDALLICVTADHATPVAMRAHSNDPVPVLVYGAVEADGVGQFGEANAARGGFGYLMGPELMPRLAQLARA
jgi:2,3-bisphosphoglycerate-independent phosphoglycerate mutase